MKWHEKSLSHCFICPDCVEGTDILWNYAYFQLNRLFSLARRPQMIFSWRNLISSSAVRKAPIASRVSSASTNQSQARCTIPWYSARFADLWYPSSVKHFLISQITTLFYFVIEVTNIYQVHLLNFTAINYIWK